MHVNSRLYGALNSKYLLIALILILLGIFYGCLISKVFVFHLIITKYDGLMVDFFFKMICQ